MIDLSKYEDIVFTIFRVMVGLLFSQHGAQKLFGAFGGTAQAAMSLMWFVGIIELLAGLAIAFGVLTRLAALGGSVIMIAAYLRVHIPQGLIPIENRGELALLFLACHILLMVKGSGKWGLERLVLKKELV